MATELRQRIIQKIKDNFASYDYNAMFRESTATYTTSFGEKHDRLYMDSHPCHANAYHDLSLKSHKNNAHVNALCKSVMTTEQCRDAAAFFTEGFLGKDSMYKDIQHLLSIVQDEKDPKKTVLVYLNDSGRDITEYERALILSVYFTTRLFTEYPSYGLAALNLWKNGFSFEESVVFGPRSGESSVWLPSYNTHGTFNGPDVVHPARYLFKIGPRKDASFPKTGGTVSNLLWKEEKLPAIFFDGSGRSADSPVRGFFGNYHIQNDKLNYQPKSQDKNSLYVSLRSFIDEYRKKYVEPLLATGKIKT